MCIASLTVVVTSSTQTGLNDLRGGQADQGEASQQEAPLEHAALQS